MGDMFQSLRYSQYSLRIGLAIVYVWFGVDKFIHAAYWIDTWMPLWAQHAARAIGMSPTNVVLLLGIFEVLMATSLLTGFFLRIFAAVGLAILVLVLAFHGFNEIMVRDIAIISALVALILWPERRYA